MKVRIVRMVALVTLVTTLVTLLIPAYAVSKTAYEAYREGTWYATFKKDRVRGRINGADTFMRAMAGEKYEIYDFYIDGKGLCDVYLDVTGTENYAWYYVRDGYASVEKANDSSEDSQDSALEIELECQYSTSISKDCDCYYSYKNKAGTLEKGTEVKVLGFGFSKEVNSYIAKIKVTDVSCYVFASNLADVPDDIKGNRVSVKYDFACYYKVKNTRVLGDFVGYLEKGDIVTVEDTLYFPSLGEWICKVIYNSKEYCIYQSDLDMQNNNSPIRNSGVELAWSYETELKCDAEAFELDSKMTPWPTTIPKGTVVTVLEYRYSDGIQAMLARIELSSGEQCCVKSSDLARKLDF